MGNRTVLRRVERVLLNANGALSTPDISAAVGASKTSVSDAIKKLREQYGARLVSKSGNCWSWHKIVSEDQKEENTFMPDLWRGWVSPTTGYAPEKLGL